VFDFAPEDFDGVQLGAVGWQVMHDDAAGGPSVNPVKEGPASVPGRVVEGDDAGLAVGGVFRRVARREAVERRGDLRTVHLALGRVEEGPLVPGHEAHDIQPLGREARQFPRGPDGLPGVGHGRDGGEARLVEVEQVDQSGIGQLLEGVLVLAFPLEGVRVAPAFQRAAAAVPRVAWLFF